VRHDRAVRLEPILSEDTPMSNVILNDEDLSVVVGGWRFPEFP
jgi:hypothetical protein